MSGKISGIYVEIKGDASQLKKELKDARQLITEQAHGMSNALANALSPAQIGKSTRALLYDLNSLANASKLTGKEFGSLGVDLKELQKLTGITEQQFQSLQSRMLQTATATAQEKALKGIATAAGLTDVEIRKLAQQMGVGEASLAKLLPPAKAVVVELSQMQKSVNQAAASLSALSKGGGLGTISQPLAALAANSRLSEAELAKLQGRLVAVQSAKAQEQAIRAIGAATGMTADQMAALGHKMGVSASVMRSLVESARPAATAISAAQVSVNQLAASLSALRGGKTGLGDVTTSLSVLAANSGLTGAELAKLQSRMLQTRAADTQERALRDLARQCGLNEREVQKLGARMGMTAGQIDKVTGASKKAKVEVQQTGNSMNWLGTVADTFLGVLGANTLQSFAFQMVELSRSILEVGMNLESLEMSFKAIFEDADLAAEKMDKVRLTAKELGQNFYVVAPGFRQMAAAAKETSLEGATTEKLFRGITAAATVLGMTTERTELSIKAFTDMISKGQIQMEEMKNQLGDNLPGAMQLFARAMGIGTDQLVKMAKEGQLFSDDVLPKVADELLRTYEKAAQTAAMETGRAAVNRLSEEWTDLKANMYDSDSAVTGIRAITEAVEGLNAVVDGAKYINWGSFVASPSAAIVAAATAAAAKNRSSTTNSMRGSVDRNNIQSVTATGVWSALDQQSMEWSIGTSNRVASAQDEAIKAIHKSREALVKYIETEKGRAKATYDAAIAGARTEEERAKALKVYEDALTKIDERANKSTKNAKKGADEIKAAVASIQKDLAEMSMSEFEFDRFELDRQFEKYAEDLGAANPLLQKWLELRRQEIRLREVGHLEPYQITELEAMNRGDSFYGKAAADERAGKMLADKNEQDLRLLTEFADKHRAIVLGETDFKLEQLDIQAEAYRKAGADEVAVAQWVAQEKLAVSRDWQDGATRALQSYADEAGNAAQNVEDVMTMAFTGLEDVIVEFVKTGKLEFADLVTSINAEIARLAFRSMASGAYDWMGGLLKVGMSAASAYFGGGSTLNPSVAPSGASGLYYSVGHHAGGIVGSEPTFMRAVNPAIFAGADRFHTGGIAGDEVPAILKRGEGVFTEGQMKALGGSDSETKALLRELVAATRANRGTKVVNAIGKGAIANELSGTEGEQVIFNHIRRNPSAVRRMLGL